MIFAVKWLYIVRYLDGSNMYIAFEKLLTIESWVPGVGKNLP